MKGRSWGELELEAIFRDHWAGRDVFSISGELGRRSKFGWLGLWLAEMWRRRECIPRERKRTDGLSLIRPATNWGKANRRRGDSGHGRTKLFACSGRVSEMAVGRRCRALA